MLLLPILFLVAGLVVLTAGADFLVRGASSLAQRFGVSPLVVGLTVVALGTSAPELVVSVKAALDLQGDIAVGNVVGSNIFNIGAILALSALVRPMRVQLQLLKVDVPLLLVATAGFVAVVWERSISRWEAGLLFSGLLAYVAWNVVTSKKQHSAGVDAEFAEAVPAPTKSVWWDVVLLTVGLAMLVAGSRLLVENAVMIARVLGVSEAVIGLTIVAAGTSMPELATSLVAAVKREADIAIGNVIGSNVFNTLGILGLAGLVKPMNFPGITNFDIVVMSGLTLLLVPLLVTGQVLRRWEGGVLLLGFAGYMAVMWPK